MEVRRSGLWAPAVIENEPFRLAALSFSRGQKFQENLLRSEQEMPSSHKT